MEKIRQIVFACLIGFLSLPASAQIDSLEKLISEATTIEDRLTAKANLGNYLLRIDKIRAKETLEQVVEEAGENDLPIVALRVKIDLAKMIDDNDRKLLRLQELLEETRKLGAKVQEAKLLIDIGSTLGYLGRYEEAIEYGLKGLRACEETEDLSLIAKAYGLLGRRYFTLGRVELSKQYFLKEIGIHRSRGDIQNMATSYNNLGIIYKSTNSYDSALWCYQRALAGFEKDNRLIDQAQCLMNIGVLYYQQDSLQSAVPYLEQGLALATELEEKQVIIQCLTNLGLVQLELKQPEIAQEYALRAMDLAKEINYPKAVEFQYYILSEAARLKNDFEAALQYYEKYKTIEDSLLNADKEARIAELENNFETNELKRQNLEIEKEKNEAIAGKRASILIAALLAVAMLAIFFYFQRNRIKSDYQAMELRQKALRAQINPHFLFNVLNSIQSAILDEKKEVAFTYHNKFARLMRLILAKSDETETSLQSELELIRLYIELEELRSNNFFSVSYEVDEMVDLENRKFPSMVLQPIIENAIWHGLMNRETPGILTIRIWEDKSRLICEVEDNGVGREKASELSGDKRNHSSFGIEISRSRMEIYSKLKNVETSFTVHDLKDPHGGAEGTLVEIFIQIRG